MKFNLDGETYTRERVGYFVYAAGVDRLGNECMVVVSHDPTASGCNPFYWNSSPYNRYGYEFVSCEDAMRIAANASGSWSVKSVDKNTIKIGTIRFIVSKESVYTGDVVCV